MLKFSVLASANSPDYIYVYYGLFWDPEVMIFALKNVFAFYDPALWPSRTRFKRHVRFLDFAKNFAENVGFCERKTFFSTNKFPASDLVHAEWQRMKT